MTVTAQEFVKEWQKAQSITELAKKLKLAPTRVSGRASTLRKKGVKLKKFSAGKQEIDVAALNEIAKANGPMGDHTPRKTAAAKSVKKAKKSKSK